MDGSSQTSTPSSPPGNPPRPAPKLPRRARIVLVLALGLLAEAAVLAAQDTQTRHLHARHAAALAAALEQETSDQAAIMAAGIQLRDRLRRLQLLSGGLTALILLGTGLGVVMIGRREPSSPMIGPALNAVARMADGDLATPVETGNTSGDGAEFLSALETMRGHVHGLTERLRSQIDHNKMILSAAGDGIFGVDSRGVFTFINPAASEMLGWPADVIIGRRVHELIHAPPGDSGRHTQVACPITRAYTEPTSIAVKDDIFYRRDGAYFPVDFTATPIIENGAAIGAVVVFRDRTGEREIQAQLIQSSKLATLGEMATSVAHELNQPLNVIRLAAENIRRKTDRGQLEPEVLKEKIETIYGNIRRAAAIIDHMRVFGRKAGSSLEPVHLRPLVDGTLSLVGQQLRLMLIEVAVRIDDDLPPALCNAIQLEQVLVNLIHNARDALKTNDINRPRVIEIVGETDPENANLVRLSVRDTGGGIDESLMDRIFEPFFTTKEVGQGTGLGLSISYGIITEMHGTLVAENTEDGALFTVTLPVAEQERP